LENLIKGIGEGIGYALRRDPKAKCLRNALIVAYDVVASNLKLTSGKKAACGATA
jgi:hypothetical protein